MEEINGDKLKARELKLLVDFRDFCDKNGLKYYLVFGTLLGAVRHKGFIPWDDDVDVAMPKEDYDKFVESFNGNYKSDKVLSENSKENYWGNYSEIIDTTTVLQEGDNAPIGAYIDVFPMHYLPNFFLFRKILSARYFLAGLFITYKSLDANKIKDKLKRTLFRFIQNFMPSVERSKRVIEKIRSNKRRNKPTNYYALMHRVILFFGIPHIHKKNLEPSKSLTFEGETFSVPKKYDKILKYVYGDYMKLPPEKDRVPNHGFTCYERKDDL